MLGQLDRPDVVVIADFEAGLGTLLRLDARPLDVVVVVVEPTAKSLEVGRRAADLVRERSLGRLVVTANRVRDQGDRERAAAVFPGTDLVVVCEEDAILQAERAGVAPLDAAPQAPGVVALVALAERLLAYEADQPARPVRRALPLG